MTAPSATLEASVAAVAALGRWISVHTGNPGTTGANEATGGSPAYAREQTTWGAGIADGIENGSQVTVDLPAGTYTYFGVWSTETGGTFIIGGIIVTTILGVQGTVLVNPKLTAI